MRIARGALRYGAGLLMALAAGAARAAPPPAAPPPPPDPLERETCEKVLTALGAAGAPILLRADPPADADETCSQGLHEARTGLKGPRVCPGCEHGAVGPKRNNAALLGMGPGGSGQRWTLAVAVRTRGEQHLETCIATDTSALRAIAGEAPRMEFLPNADKKGDAELVVWESLTVKELDPAPSGRVLIPSVYRFDGKQSFVAAPERARKVAEPWSKSYAASADAAKAAGTDDVASIQRGAARAFQLFAKGKKRCP